MFKPEESKSYEAAKQTPDSAYSRAEDIWDKRIGAAVIRARNWRYAAFGLLALSILSVGGVIYSMTRSSIVPYIVQVDANSGAILSVAPSTKRSEANEKEIEYFLWNVTRKARTIPKDLVVYKQNWEEAYSYLDAASGNKMNNMALRDNFETKIKNGNTTQLNLKGFNKYSGQDNTYQIRWEETLYDYTGKVVSVTSMEAFYTIDFIKVTEKNVHLNPLGIQIKDFSISQER